MVINMKKENGQFGASPKIVKVFIYLVLALLAITILVPVAWVFVASIKENSEFYRNPWTIPQGFHYQNFVDAWQTANMGEYMLKSVIVTVHQCKLHCSAHFPDAE